MEVTKKDNIPQECINIDSICRCKKKVLKSGTLRYFAMSMLNPFFNIQNQVFVGAFHVLLHISCLFLSLFLQSIVKMSWWRRSRAAKHVQTIIICHIVVVNPCQPPSITPHVPIPQSRNDRHNDYWIRTSGAKAVAEATTAAKQMADFILD